MSTITISNLPAAGALTGTEVLPIVQSNVTSKTTVQDIANLAGSFPYSGSAQITGSLSNGLDVLTLGNYSHAEGEYTKTGILGAYVATSVVNGVLTLSSSYGDVSGEFVPGYSNQWFFTDSGLDNNYGNGIIFLSQSYFNGTNTILESYNTNINTSTAYIGSVFGTLNGDITLSANGSHTEGYSSRSVGRWSHAEGYSITMNDNAHAEGQNTLAIGVGSHSEGEGTTALGSVSHAEGFSSTARGLMAIGDYSHAEGLDTRTGIVGAFEASVLNGIVTLSGSYGDVSDQFYSDQQLVVYDFNFDNTYDRTSFKISQSYFSSPNTIIELYDIYATTTTAYVSMFGGSIRGDKKIPANYSHTEGLGSVTIGNFSHAEGFGTKAVKTATHAEGFQTLALGLSSHAEGYQSTAAGDYSHAEGEGTVAANYATHAEGTGCYAGAWFSHAEGYLTTVAYGYGGHSEGRETTAVTQYAHSDGYGTVANQSYMNAIGEFNMTGSGDYAYFVVGKGTDDATRSNAFRVNRLGQCFAATTFTNGGADYAEFFESFDGSAIPLGTVVELTGSFIKPCTVAENAIGVISNKPSVLGNSDEGTADEWIGKYKKDIWGEYETIEEEYQDIVDFEEIKKEFQVPVGIDKEGNTIYKTEIQTAGITPIYGTKTRMVRALNSDYDPTIVYIPRAERPEWNVVGLVGQIKVLKNQPVPSKWIKMKSISSEVDLYFVK